MAATEDEQSCAKGKIQTIFLRLQQHLISG